LLLRLLVTLAIATALRTALRSPSPGREDDPRLLTPTMMLPDVTVTITADGSTPARPTPIVIVVFIVVRTLGGEGGAAAH